LGIQCLKCFVQKLNTYRIIVSSCKDDTRFISVDFSLVHSQIAAVVAEKRTELASDELEFLVFDLKCTLSTSSCSYPDEEDNMSTNYLKTYIC
jgi:hypothetical protein